jgi:hypothetical protein
MHPVLARKLIGIEPQGDAYSDMVTFLEHLGYASSFLHQDQVAEQAVKLARRGVSGLATAK